MQYARCSRSVLWPPGHWQLPDPIPVRPFPCGGLWPWHPRRLLPGLLTGSPVRPRREAPPCRPHRPDQEHRRPRLLLTPNGAWPRPCNQITDAAKQLFSADGAGLMLVDAEGQLRWASASDQTAQTLEDGQERLAQGPCAVAFSQRLPAAIRNIKLEPDWQEFTQILVSEGICAALSVPVELDGGVIGTLDVYAGQPRDWDPNEVAALQAYAGLVASLLSAATTAQVKGRLADQLQAALEHRWLIEQAKASSWAGRNSTPKRPLSGCGARPVLDSAAGRCGQGRDRWPTLPADRRKLARTRAGQAKRETGSQR